MNKLMKKLAELEAQRASAFDKMAESFAQEDIDAYESVLANIKKVKDMIAVEEARIKTEGTVPVPTDDPSPQLSEGAQWMHKLLEAVAVGSTYTSIVPTTVASEIVKVRDSFAKIRPRSRVMNASGDYTIAIESTGVTVDYVAEAAAVSESTPALEVVTFSAYKLGGLVKVSHEFLTDVAVDAMAWLTYEIGKAFAKKEDAEFYSGTGSAKSHITGITSAITSAAVTGASATAITLDEVLSLIDSLGDYRDGACLIMHPSTRAAIAKFKDTNGQYYFPIQQDLTSIRGIPIVELSAVDAIAVNKLVIVAANLSYYQIVDRAGMTLTTLNELYAVNGQVGIMGTQRIDAKPLLAAAFKGLKTKATA